MKSRTTTAAIVVCLTAIGGHAQTFTDQFGASGISSDEASQGVALADFDDDGDIDIFFTSQFLDLPFPLPDIGSEDRLYVNDGSLRFADEAPMRLVADDGFGQGAAWADYDNDGLLDLYVVHGVQVAVPEPHQLYRQGATTFDNSASTYITSAEAGRSVCWADYDNDGFVDVFVTNGLDSNVLPDAHIRLFHNEADGTFTDVTFSIGLTDTRNGNGCGWSDYDDDGDMDLYVANKGFEDAILGITDVQPNALYQNQLAETGSVSFVDVAATAGVDGVDPPLDDVSTSFGVTWLDFDNDGDMDLYVTNGFAGLIPTGIDTPNRLFINNGDGTFGDGTVTRFLLGLSLVPSFAATAGDYDNDGDLDIYVANADIPLLASATNDFYKNSGPPLFVYQNEAAAAGVEVQEFAHACASADLDGDGWLDIYSSNGTPGAELLFTNADNLWLNDGGSNHWLHLDLVGTVSNRSAIGARVTLTAGSLTMTREVSAGTGFQSMDDLRVEFGLAGETEADEITIRWPSGCVQVLPGPIAADRVIEVIETCDDDWILREPLASPVGGMYPIDDYEMIAAALTSWTDPANPLLDATTYFYGHSEAVVIKMVKSGDTVALSW